MRNVARIREAEMLKVF